MASLQLVYLQYMIVVVFGFCGLFTPATTIQPKKSSSHKSPCDGNAYVINSESGWISSPGYDGKTKYQKNMACAWNFRAPLGKVYQFNFKAFDLEKSDPCNYDSLKVIELAAKNSYFEQKARQVASLCRKKLPDGITATRRDVDFIFTTDDQVERYGFNVTYTLLSVFQCPTDQWKCISVDQCVNVSLVCNGVDNCPDGSDEIVCPNSPGCGVSAIPQQLVSPRIVGGTVSVRGSWPWSASLLTKSGRHICGVTIVHPMWAITAAHCFPEGLVDHSVVAGRYERNVTDRNEQRVYIDNYFKLKTFDDYTKQDDIAMVLLKKPFKLTDYVRTVCWPSKRIVAGEYGWIVGWGFTITNFFRNDPVCCEDKLKQATLPIIGRKACNGPNYNHLKYTNYRGIGESMMCAGVSKGRVDACSGDSGGAMVRQRVDDKRWEIQGITSWGGAVCADPKSPGVYTVVIDYMDWILNVVVDNKKN